MKTNNKKKLWLKNIIVCLILVFCECFFFRNIIHTGKLIGNDGDGRLTMLIAEHWFRFFKGEQSLSELGIFYPAKNTLGYSDILLVYGLIHSAFRTIGIDVFRAYKATLMLLHVIGTFSTMFLLRYRLRISDEWALFGTIAFSFSNSYATNMDHTQLCAISLLPLLAIFVSLIMDNYHDNCKRNIYAVLIITQVVAILYTAWYIAFFTALFVFICVVISLTFAIKDKDEIRKNLIDFVSVSGWNIILWLIYAIVIMVPFILLELPILKMSGGRQWDHIVYMPEIIDIIGVTEDNLLLGKLMARFALNSRGYAELEMGFSIVLLILFFLSYIIIAKKKRIDTVIFRILAIAVIVSLVISIRLSSNRVSLWWFVWRFFPGGSSIRAMSRYLLFLSFPMSIATSIGCDALFKVKRKNTLYKWLTYTCLIMLFISNVKLNGVTANWDSTTAKDSIMQVNDPPEDCEVFYIINASDKAMPYVQLDAYQIADKYNIKTINGYSGLAPEGWDNIWNVDDSMYLDSVNNWIEKNNLTNVYAYDYGKNYWYRHEGKVMNDE